MKIRTELRLKFDGELKGQGKAKLSEELTRQVEQNSSAFSVLSKKGRMEIPFEIKGTVTEPKVTLDTDVLEDLAKDRLVDELGLSKLFGD